MAEAWFENFFQGLALEVWRKAKKPEETKLEAEFLAAVLGVSEGGHVLDIPCGNGRLAAALAQRGIRMTGVDLSAEFIAEAQQQKPESQKAQSQKPESHIEQGQPTEGEIEWIRGDMRHIDWRDTFDGAYCFGNSFGYFPREETSAFLAAIQGALKPGARFVLDTSLAAESLLPGLEERSWSQVEDMLMLVERDYKVAESRLDTEYTFIHKGRSETRQASYWIFTVAEILRMLQESGLEAISLFASLEQEPYVFGTPRLLLVAEKSQQ